MNLLDFYGKTTLDITNSKDIGKVKYFLFGTRIQRLLYLVTDLDKYVAFKKCICGKAALTTSYVEENIDEDIYIAVKIGMPLATIDGKYLSKLKNITIDSLGNLLALSGEDRLFSAKDIFTASESLLSMQGDKYKKPPVIKKPKKNLPVNLINPVMTKDFNLTELPLQNNTINVEDNYYPAPKNKMPSTIVCKFSFAVGKNLVKNTEIIDDNI